jgi:capsular polysaccharide biosynthesis protein
LLDSIGSLPANEERREGHYFLSRKLIPNATGRRFCENESDLIEIATKEFDLKIVSPEILSWYEQVKIFRSAKSVTGLYGSALHTAILANEGLITGVIGLVNAVQTHIAGLRQQRTAYQISDFDLDLSYSVPTEKFRRMIDRIVNG